MKKPTLFILVSLIALASCSGDSFRDHVRRGNRNYREATDTLNEDSSYIFEACTEYERAIAKDSTIALAHYNAGNAYLLTGQDSIAMAEYNKADAQEEDFTRQAHIHRNIGVLLQNHSLQAPDSTKQKFLKGAVDNYKASLRYDPRNDETRYNLALCQWQLKKNQQGNDNNGGGDGQDQQNQQDQDQQNQQQNQQNQDQQQQQKQQSQQQKQDQAKEEQQKQAAEQMIQAAMQRERETQNKMNMYDRAKRQMEDEDQQNAQPRKLQKNW